MSKITSHRNQLSGGCGFLLFSHFANHSGDVRYDIKGVPEHFVGTGMIVASFNETDICKEAYEQMTSTYKLLYQSPTRLNKNSGNNCFICIFDSRPE